MKLRYLLLVAMALVIPAGLANATPVGSDPSVIINRCNDCDATVFSMNSIGDPLVITLTSQGLLPTLDLEYTGPKTTDLFIALAGSLPFEEFECPPTGAFPGGCDTIGTVGTPFSADVELKLFGTLEPGFYTIEITATPEPGTIVLLLTGGVLLIGLGRKW